MAGLEPVMLGLKVFGNGLQVLKMEHNFGRVISMLVQVQLPIMVQRIAVDMPTGQLENLIMRIAHGVARMLHIFLQMVLGMILRQPIQALSRGIL